jgi:hypothetical protein
MNITLETYRGPLPDLVASLREALKTLKVKAISSIASNQIRQPSPRRNLDVGELRRQSRRFRFGLETYRGPLPDLVASLREALKTLKVNSPVRSSASVRHLRRAVTTQHKHERRGKKKGCGREWPRIPGKSHFRGPVSSLRARRRCTRAPS